jgi:hypothetical protein
MHTHRNLGAVTLIAVLMVTGFGAYLAVASPGAGSPNGGVSTSVAVHANGGGNQGSSKGGCPDINAIANFLPASNVGATWTANATVSTYYFSSLVNENSSGGIPGLIQYCVYPEGGLPNATTSSAVGADGSSFSAVFGSVQGYFGYGRSTGDPSNVPLDGSQNVLMGTASWTFGAPSNQTVILHINDAGICNGLYNDGSQTCFVYPTNGTPQLCNGDAVCKSIVIDEASSTTPLTVPINTVLHIHYTYVIVNQPTNTFDMEILAHSSLITTGMTGAKDVFTCEQIVDPSGSPGSQGVFTNYQGTSLALGLGHVTGLCTKDLFTLTGGTTTVVLHPGQSITFTVDMTTRSHGFTGPGVHCINMGVTLRWFESDDGLIHTFHSPMVDVTVA